MRSAVLPSRRSYPAVLLWQQPAHQRSVQPGPLVLGPAPVTLRSPTADRDRTVSRRSEPSSRAALMGEQPNPWDLSLPPLLVGQDYTFTMAIRVTTNAVGASRVIGLVSRVLSHLRSERTAEGSVVTGDESLDHCRRVLTPSSRSDIQKRQCICHFGQLT